MGNGGLTAVTHREMHWSSFFLGLLTLPILISVLLLLRLLLELADVRSTSKQLQGIGSGRPQRAMRRQRKDRTPAPAQMSAVLDCLPVPTILVGRDLAVQAANLRFHSQYAGDREILGRPCYEILHGSDRPCALAGEECPLRSSARSGQTRRAFHFHMTPRGLERVEVTVRPVHDSSGEVISFVESFRPSLPGLRRHGACGAFPRPGPRQRFSGPPPG